jgi:hypothetical protein
MASSITVSVSYTVELWNFSSVVFHYIALFKFLLSVWQKRQKYQCYNIWNVCPHAQEYAVAMRICCFCEHNLPVSMLSMIWLTWSFSSGWASEIERITDAYLRNGDGHWQEGSLTIGLDKCLYDDHRPAAAIVYLFFHENRSPSPQILMEKQRYTYCIRYRSWTARSNHSADVAACNV